MATDQTTRLEAATVKAENGSQIVYDFANGAATATVQTASGPIPTLAGKLDEISDTLAISSGIYPTTAAALAATSNGQIFLVYAEDDDDIIYRVYKNQNGTAVDTGKNTISGTDLEMALDQSRQAAITAQNAADSAQQSANQNQQSLAPILQSLMDLGDYTDVSKGAQMIGYYAGIAGSKGRYAAEKLRECVSVKDFGAKGDGITDDLAALISACNSGLPLWFPSGEYLLSDTLKSTIEQSWSSFGRTKIVAGFAQGSAVRPVLDFKETVTSDDEFIIDHKANINNYGQPAPYQSNPIAGTAVLVQGDYSRVSNWRIENAWDNGIAAVRLDETTGKEVAGSPRLGEFHGLQTRYCGVGQHDRLTPGKIGAGVDVASGSAWLVSNCTDAFSYIGHILDVGAGASAQFVNCLAFYTKVDTNNPVNGSGHGFYTGSSESTFTNCYSIGSEKRGWWLDAVGNDYVNCGSYLSQEEGILIKAGQLKGNFRLKGCGAKQANTYDAVMIDCSGRNISELILDLQTTGSNHRWGVNATKGTTSNTIEAVITGSVNGIAGKVNRGDFNIGTKFIVGKKTAVNRDVAGFEYDILGRLRAGADRANQSYKTALFGDSGDNGTFFVEDFATPSKRMAMGYDPVNDSFVMQAIHAGTAKKPLLLNPSGGEVMAGTGLFNEPLRLGNYRIWVDGNGLLRIKNGAPASATDGTVVGTQTG